MDPSEHRSRLNFLYKKEDEISWDSGIHVTNGIMYMQLGDVTAYSLSNRTRCRKRKKSLKRQPLSPARYFKIQLPDCAKVSYLHSVYKSQKDSALSPRRFCRNVSALLSSAKGPDDFSTSADFCQSVRRDINFCQPEPSDKNQFISLKFSKTGIKADSEFDFVQGTTENDSKQK